MKKSDLTEKYPLTEPVAALDGDDVRALFRGAYDWLAHNYEEVNRLNVFPVPDGDTGTNMLLTLKAAWHAISQADGATVGGIFAAAAAGAHQGSRGNSGVILGQLLRGMAGSLADRETISAQDFVAALQKGSEAAYAAVPTPVEGTILTVAREAATAANDGLSAMTDGLTATADVRALLGLVVAAADESVARTPDLLPVLAEAGVVDSGGKGLYYVFDGMARALKGQVFADDGDEVLGDAAGAATEPTAHKGSRKLPPVEWGFDVQFLVEQPNKPVADILADICAMGDCPLVEGDEKLVKVHVHVFDPGDALSYGVGLGFMTDIVVENMDDMAALARIDAAEAAGSPDEVGAISLVDELPGPERIGVIAVSPGDGFTSIFHGLGVHAVVHGGQTMNPSTAQIGAAIDALPCRRIVILPNNSNIVMAAQQAADQAMAHGDPALGQRRVEVVASRTPPAGIAALVVFNPAEENLPALAEEMRAELTAVHTGEVTHAVRAGNFDGVAVEVGDIIGLADGRLVLQAAGIDEAVLALLAFMLERDGESVDAEMVSIYRGVSMGEQAAKFLTEQVRNVYPELDVELAFGGQPHYHYILSVE